MKSMVKTFYVRINRNVIESYQELSENINKYAEKNCLYIYDIKYDTQYSDAIIANVIFSDIPKELWLL